MYDALKKMHKNLFVDFQYLIADIKLIAAVFSEGNKLQYYYFACILYMIFSRYQKFVIIFLIVQLKKFLIEH